MNMSSPAPSSPVKQPCPKSPLKRMKSLEQQENMKDQENIETTYKKSPERAVTLTLQPTEVEADPNDDPADDIVALNPEEPTTLLQSKENYQEALQTQTQEEQRGIDITEILDVDSNVINYGQFVCGKILGSTLLLTNISNKDQIVTMSISKDKQYDCDQIFGQYNRDELPFEYSDGVKVNNSELEYNCWFIENPVSKEL